MIEAEVSLHCSTRRFAILCQSSSYAFQQINGFWLPRCLFLVVHGFHDIEHHDYHSLSITTQQRRLNTC